MLPAIQRLKDRIAELRKQILPPDGKLSPEQVADAKRYVETLLLKVITENQSAIETGLEAKGVPPEIAQKIISEVLAKLAADVANG